MSRRTPPVPVPPAGRKRGPSFLSLMTIRRKWSLGRTRVSSIQFRIAEAILASSAWARVFLVSKCGSDTLYSQRNSASRRRSDVMDQKGSIQQPSLLSAPVPLPHHPIGQGSELRVLRHEVPLQLRGRLHGCGKVLRCRLGFDQDRRATIAHDGVVDLLAALTDIGPVLKAADQGIPDIVAQDFQIGVDEGDLGLLLVVTCWRDATRSRGESLQLLLKAAVAGHFVGTRENCYSRTAPKTPFRPSRSNVPATPSCSSP